MKRILSSSTSSSSSIHRCKGIRRIFLPATAIVLLNVLIVLQSNLYYHHHHHRWLFASSSSSPSSSQWRSNSSTWKSTYQLPVSMEDFTSYKSILRSTTKQLSSSIFDNDDNDNVTNIPVFYNLYVSTEGNDEDVAAAASEKIRVEKLVVDQLKQLDAHVHYPVYVNSIGQQLSIPGTVQLGHYVEGQETLTLHSLWNHCQHHRHQQNARVVYLHSKGALHDREENDILRSFVTAGATSPKCTNNLLADKCDVCSIRFTPFPHPHVSGNMWSARCQYIAQLPDPFVFADMMETVRRVKTARRDYHVGRRRFAVEHWVHSFPTCLPCDVYTGNFTCGYDGARAELDNDIDLEWTAAPRFQLEYFRGNKEKDRKIDYWTGLDARIEEYRTLYNQTPSENWWGWKFNTWVQQSQAAISENNNNK
mmetsp:Transcript_15471/g.38523  ORF Transcript_15471/g.38523 Transcript_15471/m.38523 type:complete len:421 (+) Transcript_15471:66-1328(+)